MDKTQLADFLRRRREALQPEDVGLSRGSRRRTDGLRREEVALLSDMSVDYYSRLEQSRGPQPSEHMLGAIARGLRLSLEERDHLFRLAGHNAPVRALRGEHISPGLMRVLDRLQDTPAQVMSELGETLLQTAPSRALFGDETRLTGMSRSVVYRWFTNPASRDVYPAEDHSLHARGFTADLRRVYAKYGPTSRVGAIVDALKEQSREFVEIWAAHEVNAKHSSEKQLVNAEVGLITVQCQVLLDPDQGQSLLVFTATPGSESYQKLQLLSVIGNQQITAAVSD
jgi:transcriptional regulator with XRE-family HTH domain